MNTNETPRNDSASEFAPENRQPDSVNTQHQERTAGSESQTRRNLDTGEDEPFNKADLSEKSIMDFGSGSGGGAAGDGGGA